MRSRGVAPDFVTYKVALLMLLEGGRTAEDMALLLEALDDGSARMWEPGEPCSVDLHGFPVEVARLVAQLAVLRVAACGSGPHGAGCADEAARGSLTLIT